MQPVHSRLRLAGCCEDRPGVALQHLQPGLNISGMIQAGLGRQTEIGAEEGRAQLGDKLLDGVGFRTETP